MKKCENCGCGGAEDFEIFAFPEVESVVYSMPLPLKQVTWCEKCRLNFNARGGFMQPLSFSFVEGD